MMRMIASDHLLQQAEGTVGRVLWHILYCLRPLLALFLNAPAS